jgi:hypothetical protein
LFLTFSAQSFIAVSKVCLVTSTLNPCGSSICCRSSNRDLQHQDQIHYILKVCNPWINFMDVPTREGKPLQIAGAQQSGRGTRGPKFFSCSVV